MSSSLSSKRRNCLRNTKLGQNLGSGAFGSVYAILNSNGTPSDSILKISNITMKRGNKGGKKAEQERLWTFRREVYWLDKLKDHWPPLVPRLKNWKICQGQGLQVMERFDESGKDLGQRQAKQFNLDPEDNLVFTEQQLQQLARLAMELDRLGILHMDLKLANFLSKQQGKIIVVADFGFTGSLRDNNEEGFAPLMGFTTSWGCPGDVISDEQGGHLKHPIPARLLPFWNRLQTVINIRSRKLFVVNNNVTSEVPLRRLLKLFRIPEHALVELASFCPDTHALFEELRF